jgi:hypothetical protein
MGIPSFLNKKALTSKKEEIEAGLRGTRMKYLNYIR